MREPIADVPGADHMKVMPVQSGGLEEIHVAAAPDSAEADACAQTRSLYTAILRQLEDPASLRIVAERVFGSLAAKDAFLSARAEALGAAGVPTDGPVTYIEGAPVEGGALAGVQLTLMRIGRNDVRMKPLHAAGEICGFSVTSGQVRRAYLSAIHGLEPNSPPASPREQAQLMFERCAERLADDDMTYNNVVCTRIYIKRILDWYDDFNAVRTPFYRKLGIMDEEGPSTVPSSTGIQGKISDDCECVMDVTAVSKGTGEPVFARLVNPLQSEATAYGSSFARGVSVDLPDVRHVLVSGTASIDETGKSVHPDDAIGQTRRTMENFEAVLKAGGASPADLYRAVCFCKEASFAAVVREELKRRGWPEFPYIVVTADVCRHDLLVEIDGSALITAG